MQCMATNRGPVSCGVSGTRPGLNTRARLMPLPPPNGLPSHNQASVSHGALTLSSNSQPTRWRWSL